MRESITRNIGIYLLLLTSSRVDRVGHPINPQWEAFSYNRNGIVVDGFKKSLQNVPQYNPSKDKNNRHNQLHIWLLVTTVVRQTYQGVHMVL